MPLLGRDCKAISLAKIDFKDRDSKLKSSTYFHTFSFHILSVPGMAQDIRQPREFGLRQNLAAEQDFASLCCGISTLATIG